VKIALAQIDSTVADLRGNSAKILAAYRRGAGLGLQLVACPELALIGYPPRDLLSRPDFVSSNLDALAALARATGKTGLLVGYVDVHRRAHGKPLRNSVALLASGKIVARRDKTLLPNYDVFDETRYFEPAQDNRPVRFAGRRLGLSICEDAWADPSLWGGRRLYAKDPVRRLARLGADLLLNISASPFEAGKNELRLRLLARHARAARRPILYCNASGANDELVFDGASVVLDARGRACALAKSFEEDWIVFDEKTSRPLPPSKDPPAIEKLFGALVLGIRDFARKCAFQEAILGLSGGIDSAVVCALAVEALGKDRVLAVSMPSMHSSAGSVSDAEKLAKNLGIRIERVPISAPYRALIEALSIPAFQGAPGLAEQNLQARIRGTLLMALANKRGSMLLATGNKSELSVGYCTLYGDMCGALAPIGDVPKVSVYELARWINRSGEKIPQASIDKPPSAELAPGQLDQDDLPPYETLDRILDRYVDRQETLSSVARRAGSARLAADIAQRVDRNEFKRRQSPPVLKVSAKAFGIGRRMPIARAAFPEASNRESSA